jgi:hypothetical protein
MSALVRRITLLAGILMTAVLSCFAQQNPDIPIPEIKYTKFVLKNGLTLWCMKTTKRPSWR